MFIAALFSLFYCDYIWYNKFVLAEKWRGLRIIIIILIIFIIIPFTFIKNRYDISQNGIYKYSIFELVKKEYSWSDVSEATAYVDKSVRRGGSGTYAFSYDVKLNNGKCLKLYKNGHSDDIWNSLYITDNILKDNNIHIHRNKKNLDKLDKEYRDRVKQFIY